MKEFKTIKELADELNQPKNRINYQASKLDSNYIVKIDGTKYLNNEAQNIIRDKLSIKLDTKKDTELDRFKHQIKHLESQIKTKDDQINKLQNILDQQQQLQLKTYLIIEEKNALLNQYKSKKWYQFWKKKY